MCSSILPLTVLSGGCLGKEHWDKPLVVTPPGGLSQFDQFAAQWLPKIEVTSVSCWFLSPGWAFVSRVCPFANVEPHLNQLGSGKDIG